MINIKIDNLQKGQTIKNYKELCSILDIKHATNGNTKNKQLEELKLYCKYEKDGNKFVIKEIYKTPIKIDLEVKKLKSMKNYKPLECFKISVLKFKNIGVYYILKDNDIYIGSTIQGFRNRFLSHYKGQDKKMKHTYELLQKGGNFYILQDMTGIEDEQLIRMVENEYINYFINYTDYNVINKLDKVYWQYKNKNCSNKLIKINGYDYEKAIEILSKNNIEIKNWNN
ncbi:GIY-YIG nuclease family protein [Clostridium sp. M14]|uniref:GIY-YIG nuclease family protein n=1 Tax=Clostridium sp. M14 TaxID=2716311 RepID=UPI0013EE7D21|nr:GIY-YIG nuclease family protein [Clostridium sp. M14]MBZ9693385.1 GIY-YIG nuclease family protein [Clostridium sp. M14]